MVGIINADSHSLEPKRHRCDKQKTVLIGSVQHFLVDALCLCSLYLLAERAGNMDVVRVFILYNVLAFTTQPLTGWWTDRLRHRHWVLLASMVLLTVAVVLAAIMVKYGEEGNVSLFLFYADAFLLGMGNSCFHVWGGKQVAVMTNNDIRAMGTFVSTGAFGLAVGTLLFSWSFLFILLLSFCVLTVFCIRLDNGNNTPEEELPHPFYFNMVSLWVAAIMLLVAFRSWASEGFTVNIIKNPFLVLLLGAVSMLGKMMGGWIAHWIGISKAIGLFLIAALTCFLLKGNGIALVLLGMFSINCTMPITLYWASILLKGKEGLAFGLLAASLIPGYLLATLLGIG